jgi:L-alanine-DL-glutamate epimerase-like enolase superfamily enzyme
MKKNTDIRIVSARTIYERNQYRAPMKFGGVAVNECTVLNVECEVETREGRRAVGFGSMPLANTWAFPSRNLSFDQTLGAMRSLSERCRAVFESFKEYGHPIELGLELEESFLEAAKHLDAELALGTAIPKLCTLVCGSAYDAALHDAYGKAHGLNCYATYSAEFLGRDLSHWLGGAFSGEFPAAYVSRTAQPRMPLYHLVGALDPLDDAELDHPVGDGVPETLPAWIQFNGLTHFKIKLNGDEFGWDYERIIKVNRICEEQLRARGGERWWYSLDFNERCQSVEYLLELLEKLRLEVPRGFERIQYVEQPTDRDLAAHPENKMHRAAKLKPVVIDESLTDLESLELARELGYTGAALKACKGQSQSLLMAAAARKMGLFLCVQDLSCPGASLIHSAGLAAHVLGVAAIESNSRQYCPAANRGWEDRFPGIFKVRDGQMHTSCLDGVGLGAVSLGGQHDAAHP